MAFVPPDHPSIYHYRKKGCRCQGCKYLTSQARKAYPSYKLKTPTYRNLLPEPTLKYLRELVGYDPTKDYDSMEAI